MWAEPTARAYKATTKTLTRPEEYTLVDMKDVPKKAIDTVNKKLK